MARKRNIYELERRVKDEYNIDPMSGDFYQAVRDLASAILAVKFMAFTNTEIDEISHMLACDIWEKVGVRKEPIYAWTKYIQLRLKKMRERYLRETRSIDIYVEDLVEASRLSDKLMFTSKQTDRMIEKIEVEDAAASIWRLILDLFDKTCRYIKGSPRYSDIKSSFLISLTSRFCNGFNQNRIILVEQDALDEKYVGFLVDYILKRVGLYILAISTPKDNLGESELIMASWNM